MPFKAYFQQTPGTTPDAAAQKAAARSQGIIRTRPVEQVKIMLPGVRVSGLRVVEVDREARAERLESWTTELGRDADMLGRGDKNPLAKDQAPPVLEEPAVTLPGIAEELAKWNLMLLNAFVEVDAKPGSNWTRTQLVFGPSSDARTISKVDAPAILGAMRAALEKTRYECFVYENWRPRDEAKGKAGGLLRELTVNLRKGKAIKVGSTVEVKRLAVDGNVLRAVPLGT